MELTLKTSRERFYELDILRFAAACAVMVYHFTFAAAKVVATPVYHIGTVTRYGYLGVDVFFMISGYVVLMSAMGKVPKNFVISRFVRLYPAYWAVCLLFILQPIIACLGKGQPLWVSIKLLCYNLTMLQEFFGKPHLNGVFWTLTYEISFYFIILLISALRLWKHLLPVIIVWLACTFIIGQAYANNAFYFLLIPKYSPCFIAGMLCYLLHIKYCQYWKIAILLVFCYMLNLKSAQFKMWELINLYHTNFNNYLIIALVTCFYIIFVLLALGKLNSQHLKKVANLGKLTYPLYLVHTIGIGLLLWLNGRYNKHLLLAVAIALSFIAAYLIYRFVELKFSRKLKALLEKLMPAES